MMVSCNKCSKMLKVKDEFAGKMLKCPQCGSTFRADPTGKTTSAAPAGGPRVMNIGSSAPAPARSAGKPVPQPKPPSKKGGGVAINWGTVIKFGALALIPIAIALFLFGPMRVKRAWDAAEPQVSQDVTEIVEQVMKSYASNKGLWNPRKSGNSPSVGDLQFYPNYARLSSPSSIKFDGFGTSGRFEGEYVFATGEIDMTLKAGGVMLSGIYNDELGKMLPGGIRESSPAPGMGKGNKLEAHHVTGRIKDGAVSAEIDGKKAEIYYPPDIDDEGNPIVPDKDG